MRTGRALRQLPFVAEQVPEEIVAPLRWRGGPGYFEAAADCVAAFTGAKAALPAEALLLDAGSFRRWTHQCRITRTMGFAEGVTTGDQRYCLFVVHRHARESFADILRRSERVGVAVWAFRVHIDKSHLHRSERIFEIPVSGVAFLSTQPGLLVTPVDIFFGFPDILTPTGETEGLEAHRFQCNVAREDHQVSP